MIKSDNSIKKMCIIYFISLIPVILYGFYKNGIYLYIKKYVGIYGLLKPLLFVFIGGILGILINIIYEKIIKKNKNSLDNIIFSNFYPVYGILISCIVSINTNIILFSLITFITLFICRFLKNKFNVVCLTALIIFLITSIFGKFTFLNNYELNNNFNLETIDYLFGKGSGGIFATNILLIILGYIILYISKIYKKNIPIFSFISFLILTIIYNVYLNKIGNILNMLFTNGILFSFVFIAPDSPSSSYTNIGQVIFGILVGITTFLLYLLNPYLSSFGAIFIVSILNNLIDLKFE